MAVGGGIRAVFLQKIEYIFRQGQGFFVFIGDGVLGQGVDGKAFPIHQLGRVGHRAVPVQHPVYAAIHGIKEIFLKNAYP